MIELWPGPETRSVLRRIGLSGDLVHGPSGLLAVAKPSAYSGSKNPRAEYIMTYVSCHLNTYGASFHSLPSHSASGAVQNTGSPTTFVKSSLKGTTYNSLRPFSEWSSA